jgi:hypothetical protein
VRFNTEAPRCQTAQRIHELVDIDVVSKCRTCIWPLGSKRRARRSASGRKCPGRAVPQEQAGCRIWESPARPGKHAGCRPSRRWLPHPYTPGSNPRSITSAPGWFLFWTATRHGQQRLSCSDRRTRRAIYFHHQHPFGGPIFPPLLTRKSANGKASRFGVMVLTIARIAGSDPGGRSDRNRALTPSPLTAKINPQRCVRIGPSGYVWATKRRYQKSSDPNPTAST